MYGHVLPDEVRSIYWEQLKSWGEDKFKSACNNIVATFVPSRQTPFPLIPHFLAAVGLDSESKARNAVAAVKEAAMRIGRAESVSFANPALHAVIESYGGWPAMCCWDEDEWKYREVHFIGAYKSAVAAGYKGPEYLIGTHEKQNRLGGYDDWVKPPLLWTGGTPLRLEKKKEPLELEKHEPDEPVSVTDIVEGLTNAKGL